MLRNVVILTFVLMIFASYLGSSSFAWQPKYEPCSATQPADPVAADVKGITKVKPSSQILKVKPGGFGFSQGLRGISRFNPMNWGLDCCLPAPAKGQFVVDSRFNFMRVNGEVRHGQAMQGVEASVVNFDDHLGMAKTGNTIWSIDAHYQFQPRWGLRYSFMPIDMDGSKLPVTSFRFGGQTYTGGQRVRSKWERYEHKIGVAFDLKRTTNSVTTLLAEWRYIQERLTVGQTTGTATAVTLDDDKSLAFLGLEFNKCLKNYRGSTLAMSCMGGVSFLDDHIGYDAEASLSYLIPIRRGRFGFIKGGYRYAQLKKDKGYETLSTQMDGAFVSVGFLF